MNYERPKGRCLAPVATTDVGTNYCMIITRDVTMTSVLMWEFSRIAIPGVAEKIAALHSGGNLMKCFYFDHPEKNNVTYCDISIIRFPLLLSSGHRPIIIILHTERRTGRRARRGCRGGVFVTYHVAYITQYKSFLFHR